jgi:hypothetical protein
VADIEFPGATEHMILRHASFKGLRDQADGASVFEL